MFFYVFYSKINVFNIYDNNNHHHHLIYIAPACRMTSEALADSSYLTSRPWSKILTLNFDLDLSEVCSEIWHRCCRASEPNFVNGSLDLRMLLRITEI